MARHALLAAVCATALAFALATPAAAAGQISPPGQVRAAGESTSQILVSWSGVMGAIRYDVLRGTTHGGPYAAVGSTTSFQFEDAGLQPATTYYYVVRSASASRVSRNSAEASATTRGATATNLRATADGARVDLAWDAAPGAVRYDVLRSDSAGQVLAGSTTGTQLTDATAANDTRYSYLVRTYSAAGVVGDSRALDVLTGLRSQTTLTVSPAPSEAGQDVLLTATVVPVGGTVTSYFEQVEFFADDRSLGYAYVDLSRGGAADLTAELAEGAHVLYAHYDGDPTAHLGSSSSSPATQTVQPASARVTFAAAQALSVGSWPTSVAIADVTGDGLADALLSTTQYGGEPDRDFKLWLFAQRADHTLAAPVALATHGAWGSPMLLATGDVDGDGRADVAVAVSGGVDVFLQGSGGPGAPTLVPVPGTIHDLRIADVDRDGRGDLVVAADQVAAYPNTSGASFGAPVVIEAAVRAQVEIADVDGDGVPDAVTLSSDRTFFVDVQSAPGVFVQRASRQVPTGYFPVVNAIAVGDLTGDGRPDVAATVDGNVPGSRVQVFGQDGAGAFGEPVTYASYDEPEPLALVDLDRDGRLDVVTAHGGWNDASVMLQRPDGRLGAQQRFSIPYASHYGARGLAVGDLDGDGRPDIAVADYNNGLVVLRQV